MSPFTEGANSSPFTSEFLAITRITNTRFCHSSSKKTHSSHAIVIHCPKETICPIKTTNCVIAAISFGDPIVSCYF